MRSEPPPMLPCISKQTPCAYNPLAIAVLPGSEMPLLAKTRPAVRFVAYGMSMTCGAP